jgi:hypothetical protein
MITTSCHCGAVSIQVPTAPQDVAECNCSICRRLGGLWAYYSPRQVTVTGETETYVWGDKMLSLHRCKTCGCTTHWTPMDPDYDRMGVNMRMADPAVIAGVPVRKVDNAG